MVRLLGMLCGAVLHSLAIFLKIVYNILKILRMRILALYLLVCIILQLCFHLFGGAFGATYFWTGFAVCCLPTLFGWTEGLWERRRRKKLAEREYEIREKREEDTSFMQAEGVFREKVSFPLWFGVEGRPDFAFAEYEDRYELFRREEDKWVYVRTDYKTEGKHL